MALERTTAELINLARTNRMNTILNREHFEISRSDEYFNAKELQAQTGQPSYKFGEVVLK